MLTRPRGLAMPAALAIALACAGALAVGGAAGVASAAPGTPGTPQAPVVVYAEDFENGQGAVPIQLPGYTGAPPVNATYTADPAFLANCNGWIASRLDPPTEPPGAGCSVFWPDLPNMAGVLGQFAGTGAGTNHALGDDTFIGPGPDKVVLETSTPISLSATSRFLTFSVDVAEIGCAGVHSLLQFYLLDGATAI